LCKIKTQPKCVYCSLCCFKTRNIWWFCHNSIWRSTITCRKQCTFYN
jgi:hypothetical protein